MLKGFHSRGSWLDVLTLLMLTVAGVGAVAAPAALLRIAPPCLWSALTGHPCWGCGMTRAMVAALRGELAVAWNYNSRVIVVLPILCFQYVRLLGRVARVAMAASRLSH